jgi:hypothetical protein
VSTPWRSVTTCGFVVAAAVGTWLVSGVGLVDVGLFVGYQLAWVVLPGLALHRLLDPDARGLERVAVGWALGYAVSIAAFHLTAALGVRELYFAVPLLALPLVRRRPRLGAAEVPAGAVVGLGVVACLAIVFQALSFVPLTPLPGTTSAAYPPDPMFHLSVAAEARHHFPVTDPKVSGTPLPYHLFAHYDMAAVNQVTGIDLPVAVFRLVFVPLVALAVLVVGLLAAQAGAVRAGIPLAAALFLFTGEIDLQPDSLFPFWGGTFFGLTFSPSFLLSIPIFGALLLVVRRVVETRSRDRGLWVLCGMLAWALGGAKAGSLAVLIGGCLLFALARFIRDRVVERAALAVAALGAAIAGVQVFVLYGGAGSGGVQVRFLGAVRSASAVDALVHWLAILGPLGTLLAWAIGLFAMLAAPLFAAALAPRGARVWMLYAAISAAGLVAFLTLTHPGSSQLHLMQLGLMTVAALGGAGFERLLASRGMRRVLLAVGSVWVAALVGVAYLPSWYDDVGPHGLRYGGLFALGAVVIACANRLRIARRTLLVSMAVLAAAVNVPLDTIAPLASAHRAGGSLSAGDDVTPALHAGLAWIRGHTAKDDVIAVNNQNTNRGRFDNFVYSAITERRVFLEGWLYSIPSLRGSYSDAARGRRTPFSSRQGLNDAVFGGDAGAAETLTRRYGVRYLVVDKLHGTGAKRARRLGRLVYSNPAVDVVALD